MSEKFQPSKDKRCIGRMEGETAAERHRRCSPFCPIIEFCGLCANLHALCSKHTKDPDSGVSFRAVTG